MAFTGPSLPLLRAYAVMGVLYEIMFKISVKKMIFYLTLVLYSTILCSKEEVLISKSKGGFLISKIKQIQGRVFEKLLMEHGIDEFNGAQGRILFVLWDNDNIPISELSEKTGLAKTTLTSMLDRLEKSGYVQRLFYPEDRRKINIKLTNTAKNLKSKYNAVSAQMNEIFYKDFKNREIIAFEAMLTRILNNLTVKDFYKE